MANDLRAGPPRVDAAPARKHEAGRRFFVRWRCAAQREGRPFLPERGMPSPIASILKGVGMKIMRAIRSGGASRRDGPGRQGEASRSSRHGPRWPALTFAAFFAAALALSAVAPSLALAQEAIVVETIAPAPSLPADAAPEAAPAAEEEAAPIMDKGDVAWMMTATVLVVAMIIPGLGLFYGGLVRAKNMLSVLMQVSTVAAIGFVCYALWGYSLAFTDSELFGNLFIGSTDRLFLNGI